MSTKINSMLEESGRLRFACWLILGLSVAAVLAKLFFDSFLWIIFTIFSVPLVLIELYKAFLRKRDRETKKEFKDALLSIVFSLNAGLSIENAFVEALHEMGRLYGKYSNIYIQFSVIVRKLKRNITVEEAFDQYARGTGLDDIIYFSEVFTYAKRSGGNLMAIIRETANLISEKLELEDQILTKISGKKAEQMIMSLMPAAMIAYLRLSSDHFLDCLYGNLLGNLLMMLALLFYAFAFWLGNRIVDIRV